MGAIVLLALTAAFNPTEIAATTVMLLLPSPERLMLGYWLGAMLTQIVPRDRHQAFHLPHHSQNRSRLALSKAERRVAQPSDRARHRSRAPGELRLSTAGKPRSPRMTHEQSAAAGSR